MKFLFTLLVFFVSNTTIYSQVSINGKLINEGDEPVIGASVIIKQGEDMIAYDISDNNGFYSITFSIADKDVIVEVRSMSYKTETRTVTNKNQTLNFKLSSAENSIKEVIIKSSPIERNGDTLSYYVDSFAKDQDRSIGDVLSRMPGIEIQEDGKILYQGKPINKYYIEGLDLLEGKYNLANENLPYKEVTEIQILENHQPIKVLDSLVFSDNAALNIKLKNTYTFTGQAELGSGLSPLLWDANITPLLFTKKQQMLASYQANNTGNDVAKQLKTLTIEDLIEQFENNTEKQDWLSIQQLGTPNFSEQRWLDNNVHLITGNYLQKLKKDYELRINTSYLNDYQQQNGFTNTLFFTPNDTISLFENKYNLLYFNSLETNVTLQKNTEKNYLKNSLNFQGYWDSQRGNIQINQDQLFQDLKNEYFKFSNKFKTVFPAGKQLLTLNSYIGYNQTPQTLSVNPGQFEDLLNNGTEFEELIQEIELNTLYTNNSISFTKRVNRFTIQPKIGFLVESQNLASNLSTEDIVLQNQFKNDLDWVRSKPYLDIQTEYTKNNWRLKLQTPLNYHFYQIEDEALQQIEDFNQLTFEPRLSAIYDANAFWKFSSSASFNNQFGTINQLYYAFILNNYRNIRQINTPLPQIFNQNISGGVSYRNPIKSLFWNILYTNISSANNLLYQNQILENGATELQAIEQDNNKISQNLTSRLNKYFTEFNTNVSISANFGVQDFEEVINNEITEIQNKNWGVKGKLDTDFTNWFNTEYQSNWFFSKNEIQNQDNNTILQQSHLLNLNFYPKENQYFAIRTEFINNKLVSENIENLFADFVYRYSWEAKNIDFEIQGNNLFNTENYRTINIDAFTYIETNFRLRPRQVLFNVRFSL